MKDVRLGGFSLLHAIPTHAGVSGVVKRHLSLAIAMQLAVSYKKQILVLTLEDIEYYTHRCYSLRSNDVSTDHMVSGSSHRAPLARTFFKLIVLHSGSSQRGPLVLFPLACYGDTRRCERWNGATSLTFDCYADSSYI